MPVVKVVSLTAARVVSSPGWKLAFSAFSALRLHIVLIIFTSEL